MSCSVAEDLSRENPRYVYQQNRLLPTERKRADHAVDRVKGRGRANLIAAGKTPPCHRDKKKDRIYRLVALPGGYAVTYD